MLRASGALFLVFVSVFFAFAAATDYVLTTSLSLAFYLAAGLVAHRLWAHGRYVKIVIAVFAVPLTLLSADTLARLISSLSKHFL